MKTLSLQIPDAEYQKYKFKGNSINFSDIKKLILAEIGQQTLLRSTKLAAEYGLSEMSMEDINKEIQAVRKNRKNA